MTKNEFIFENCCKGIDFRTQLLVNEKVKEKGFSNTY